MGISRKVEGSHCKSSLIDTFRESDWREVLSDPHEPVSSLKFLSQENPLPFITGGTEIDFRIQRIREVHCTSEVRDASWSL